MTCTEFDGYICIDNVTDLDLRQTLDCEFGVERRRYFRKGGDNRTHQIHIFEQSNHKEINRHIAVRDFLRTHPDIALEYGELKMKLAFRFPDDIEGYVRMLL